MIRSRALLLPLALFVLVLVACGEEGGSSSDGGSSGAASPGGTLEGVSWRLSSFDGFEGSPAPGMEHGAVTARFADGTLSGSGGCNTYHAGYTLDGTSLQIGPIASTRMACGGPVDALETAYFAALERVASYRIDGSGLVLLDADGATLLTYGEVKPAPLTGTAWNLVTYNTGSALSSTIAGTEITATFSQDGKISGSSGCNSYSGTYTTEGDSMRISDVAGTMMACSDPKGIMEQESAYLAALGRVAAYEIDGTDLVLSDDQGTPQATFAAA